MQESIYTDYQTRTRVPNERQAPSFDLGYIIDIIFRRMRMIIGIALLCTLFGGLFLSFQVTQYTATAVIQINTNAFQPANLDPVYSTRLEDNAAIESELDIIKSRPLIRNVVNELELYNKYELNPSLYTPTVADKMKGKARSFIKGDSQQDDMSAEDAHELTVIKVTNAVQDRLSVRKDPLSYTVKISYTSRHPKLARTIANAIATEYMSYQIESTTQANKNANEWLSSRVQELKKTVKESDQAVQAFVEKHGLFELDGKTLDDQQISELNSQLVVARTAYAQAEARLGRARQLLRDPDGISSVKEVLDSALIQSLREEEANLLRKQSELASHFGPKHPSISKVNGELRDLRLKIDMEIQKIVKGLENEVAISRVRVNSLSGQLAQLRGKVGKSTKQEIELAELQREAQANRALYESFLAQMKETREAESLKQAKAKFIAEAEVPMVPSYPNKKLILALFILAGGFIGTTLALALEFLGHGFTTPEQIEENLGILNLGMVPEMKIQDNDFARYNLQKTSTVYTEAMQNIIASINFQNRDNPPKSIMVVSAQPQEGKGWTAVSMARAYAQSGKSVLLIDCDLNRPALSKYFDNNTAPKTLNDFLENTANLRDIVNVEQVSGVHYITSKTAAKGKQKLLGSSRMKRMILLAREKYDMVIMDAPPVVGMSDVLFLSELADTSVLAIRWATTSRKIVAKALRTLSRAQVNLTGTIMTRVPLKKYKEMEFGGLSSFRKYKNYYHLPELEKLPKPNVLRLVSK